MLHMFLDDDLILQTSEAGLERIWAISQGMDNSGKSTVNEFIAERRTEAANE